jgi:hypothetical protein
VTASQLFELFVLGLMSAIWPLLIAFVVLSLRTERPAGLLAGFLAGGLLATVAIGTAIVLSLHDTRLATTDRSTTSATVDLVVAALLLLVAWVLSRPIEPAKAKEKEAKQGNGWSKRAMEHGTVGAFIAGIVFNIIPGFVPFVALTNIAQLEYGAAASCALVIGFYLVMFLLVEIPLFGLLVAPVHTKVLVERFNAWLDRNLRRALMYAALVAAVLLVVRAVVKLT